MRSNMSSCCLANTFATLCGPRPRSSTRQTLSPLLSCLPALVAPPALRRMTSLIACTCRSAIRRAATSSHAGRQQVNFSVAAAARYPRQATPFRPAAEPELGSSADAKQAVPWYMQEAAPSPSATGGASAPSPASTPTPPPPPPTSLPSYLHPLWTHLFDSPFLHKDSIRFIDVKAIGKLATESDEALDASVGSWTDWTVVATLRKGRERGIAGASDGVRLAVSVALSVLSFSKLAYGPRCDATTGLQIQESLDAFDDEQLLPATPTSTSGTPKKRTKKRKILVEGLDVPEPHWCLVDGGRVVVHIMTERGRRTWQVESAAGGVPHYGHEAQTQTRTGQY